MRNERSNWLSSIMQPDLVGPKASIRRDLICKNVIQGNVGWRLRSESKSRWRLIWWQRWEIFQSRVFGCRTKRLVCCQTFSPGNPMGGNQEEGLQLSLNYQDFVGYGPLCWQPVVLCGGFLRFVGCFLSEQKRVVVSYFLILRQLLWVCFLCRLDILH